MDSKQQDAQLMLGQLLVKMGACAAEDVRRALEASERIKQPLGQVLLGAGTISKNDLIHALAVQRKTVMIRKLADLPDYTTLLSAPGGELGIERIDKRVALLGEEGEGRKRVFVLISEGEKDPTLGQDALIKAQGKGWQFAARSTAPAELISLLYDKAVAREAKVEAGDYSEMHKLFDRIGHDAFKRNASDIHLTVLNGAATVSYRIHGQLDVEEDMTVDRATALAASAYNTMTEAGSTKEGFNPRLLQDAVIERTFDEGMVRFRYSCIPLAPLGFDVTLRVIPIGVQVKRKSFLELGYSPDQNETLERMFGTSSGLILFAGTTGSGKSTSLAHALMGVASANPGKKIRTVEEPVEFRIPGAYQTPVVRIAGDKTDFTNVLRQVLRSDPDIIMVGEIRDIDTAEVTIQAVRSGHLCVSTLHADGAPLCYDRMAGMGVPRTDLASVGLVAGLVYQRLVPLLCSHCKIPAEDLARSLSIDARVRGVLSRVRAVNNGDLRDIYFRNTTGCPHCLRGHTGRTVAAEILRPTPAMLHAIAGQDSNTVWRMWRSTISEGNPAIMTGRTAFEHAIFKMRAGLVSPMAVESEFRFLDEQPWKGLERVA